jgi:osmotically-inducible protein OsmY
MDQEQVLHTDVDKFYRCEEQAWAGTGDLKNHDRIQEMDAELKEKLDHALWKDDVLRVTDYNEIDIHVKNGIVYLSGHILSTTNWHRVEKALSHITGIHGIISNLVMDDELIREVATSLGQLEQRCHCKFFTGASNGFIILNGEVSNTNLRLQAEQSAASHPKVRGVINYVRVPGVDFDGQDNRIMQPPIGKEILFSDGVSGIVQQVVINSGNRRVIAMIIQGQIYASSQNLTLSNNSTAQAAKQIMVIPANIIEYLTKNSGFLTIKSTDFTKYQKFDASRFTAPAKGWVPPYPYCPEEVLFPVEYQSAKDKLQNEDLLANDSLGG